jgi:hypothetical protein
MRHPGVQAGVIAMRSKQRGVTLIGWVILLAPMAIVFYAAIRLAPVYLNYMKVVRTLEQVKTEFKGNDPGGITLLKATVEKHLNVESVDYPDIKDIKIKRDGHSWVVSATYDDQAPLFSNVFILVSFDKSVTIGSSGVE